MRWTEITERARANLYHRTNPESLQQILNTGYIKPNHGFENNEKSISLSRDKFYGKEIYGDIQLVVDQDRLRSTHKIKPVDYNRELVATGTGKDVIRTEREERVYKPIPLKYIIEINFDGEKPPKYTVKSIEKHGLKIFYHGKPLSSSDYESKEFVVVEPGLSMLAMGQELDAAEVKELKSQGFDFTVKRNT